MLAEVPAGHGCESIIFRDSTYFQSMYIFTSHIVPWPSCLQQGLDSRDRIYLPFSLGEGMMTLVYFCSYLGWFFHVFWMYSLFAWIATKRSCQGKKNQKSRDKLGLVGPHPPYYPIFYIFFWNILKHENNTKNTKKHKISKKKKPSRGSTHPPTFDFFSDFLELF